VRSTWRRIHFEKTQIGDCRSARFGDAGRAHIHNLAWSARRKLKRLPGGIQRSFERQCRV